MLQGGNRLDVFFLIVIVAVTQTSLVLARDAFEGNEQRAANPDAVAKAKAGELTEVNAAWWGFDPEDSTRFLQAAIDSGAKRVVVSNMGADWVITPITLVSDQEIFFEPGVVVTAKPGSFHGKLDSLFTAMDKNNITLTGYGATLRMQKADYMSAEYEKAEWRCGILLSGCSHVTIQGLTIRDTGGDGILMSDWGKGYSDNVTIRDMLFDNNYRQGISVTSAATLLIENCVFRNTTGTGPSAGIDLEPDHDGIRGRLVDIVVRNCIAENNDGPGFVVSPAHLTSKSEISVLFENCLVRSGRTHGLMVSGIRDDGPSGYVEFRNCHVENTRLHGARILDKSSNSAVVRFINCTFRNVAHGDVSSPEDAGPVFDAWDIDHPNRYDGVPNLPIIIHVRDRSWTARPGGVIFTDCVLHDDKDRPFIGYAAPFPDPPALHEQEIMGNITVINPYGVWTDIQSLNP